MKKAFSLAWVAVCAATLMLPTMASAQGSNPIEFEQPPSKFLAGPRLLLNRNFHTGGFRTINDVLCPVFDEGSGWGWGAGLTFEYLAGKTWSIVPALTYESRPGSFTQRLPDAEVLLPGATTTVMQTVEATSEIAYTIASLEVLYKQEFAQFGDAVRLSVAAGPSASVVLSGTRTQHQDLIQPENARFIPTENGVYEMSGRRQVFMKDQEITELSGTRFSLKAGVQAELGLFNNAIIMYPGVFFDYGLTHVTSAEDWNLNSIIFQVDFRRAF